MTVAAVNYKETHFPHQDLTKIIGTPTYVTLHELFIQLKANALSVHSNLGGGQHGHLGLLLSPNAYALLSATPYIRPPYPPPIVYHPFLTTLQINTLQTNHKSVLNGVHDSTMGNNRARTKGAIPDVNNL